MGRRLARELALKILYRCEEGDTDLPAAERSILETKKYLDGDKKFCLSLIEKTMTKLSDIDAQIIAVLQNWPYERVSVVDKAILRLGVCEILYFDDIPAQVSINEAIELGKKYGGDKSSKFVNGILDAIKKNYESSHNK